MKETGLSEDKVKEIFPKSFFVNKTMRQIVCAMDKVIEQFDSIEVKPGVKAHPQLLKLIVIAKRLGVSNDNIIAYIVRHIKTLDRFYIDRLIPVIALNPKTRMLESVDVDADNSNSYVIDCQKINGDGTCVPEIRKIYLYTENTKILKGKIEQMLSLLGC